MLIWLIWCWCVYNDGKSKNEKKAYNKNQNLYLKLHRIYDQKPTYDS
jgi:hypothetical protein